MASAPRVAIGLRLTPALLKMLDRYAKANGVSRTAAVEILIRAALAKGAK